MANLFVRTFYYAAIPLILVYIFVPALFFFFPNIMQHVFFLNFVKFRLVDYYDLSHHGVRSRGRNFYLRERDVTAIKSTPPEEAEPTIGIWHILPNSLSAEGKEFSDAEMEKLLDAGPNAVFIYLHGNSFDRTTHHRVELYNVLSALDFHVLAVDYRGYGDSSGHPDESGLNEDAHAIFEYARRHAPTKDIYVWGHSMGTGVATRLVAELSDAGTPPKALVLESPFNNLRDVVRNHPFSLPLRWLPWFDAAVVDPLIGSGLLMNSDERIQRISCPILILHAEDDHIIPIKLGRKLADSARAAGRELTFIDFESQREYMHKFIHRAPELPTILREFIERGHLQQRSKNRLQQNRDDIKIEL